MLSEEKYSGAKTEDLSNTLSDQTHHYSIIEGRFKFIQLNFFLHIKVFTKLLMYVFVNCAVRTCVLCAHNTDTRTNIIEETSIYPYIPCNLGT